MSFLRTKRMSPSAGNTDLNAEGKTILPLSSVFAVYSPMNVIISSADYWTRANIKDQSILEVDDVQYLYYSQLAELSYDGKSIDGFSKDKYEYTITADYDESKLSAKADGIGAIVEKSYDEETHKLTITVKGNDISANTENFHTYT